MHWYLPRRLGKQDSGRCGSGNLQLPSTHYVDIRGVWPLTLKYFKVRRGKCFQSHHPGASSASLSCSWDQQPGLVLWFKRRILQIGYIGYPKNGWLITICFVYNCPVKIEFMMSVQNLPKRFRNFDSSSRADLFEVFQCKSCTSGQRPLSKRHGVGNCWHN